MFLLSKEIKKLNNVKSTWAIQVNDSYSIGVYNGLELALSILECREPEYFMLGEEEGKEEQEIKEYQRTMIGGQRRVVK